MAKNLLIVESPAKSKTLKKFLGRDFEILATIGHIKDLPKSKLGVDTDNGFSVHYETIKGKTKVIKQLKDSAKKSQMIYLAPDPDREGEAIAWHVARELKTSDKIVRVTFNEITKNAVLDALQNTRDIDENLVNAQQARRVLDRLVGYKVSPFLWKTITYGLSAGRVQSVALRIVCEREKEISDFVIEEYWELEADLADKKNAHFRAKLTKIDGEKPKIENGDSADKITADVRKQTFVVDSIKKSERKRKPSPPFITSTLQQEAARYFYFTPKKTMMIAQQLYEGVELGDEGATGLITYMRTDSTRIAESALAAVREHIDQNYGGEYLPAKAVRYASKKGSQDAHEAIRPTYLELPPEKLKKYLTKDQLKLYTLIWNRFVACQMNPAVYDTTTVDINAGKYIFHAAAQALKFDGFLKVYQEAKENGNGNGSGNGENGLVDFIPDIKEGDKLKLVELFPSQHFTKPPARYTQASLVKMLESEGIGRPSTYATIISTLLDRKYVEAKERRLFATELGQTVNKILVESFPTIFSVQFTAHMEDDLDQIETGKADWVDVIKEFYGPFDERLSKLSSMQKEIKESLTEATEDVCENCGSPMVIKWGRNGRFLACTAYPECKTTKPLNGAEEVVETDEKCEKCGSPMVVKSGRFGKFLACSAYPKCKSTKPLSTGVKCPKDGCGGNIVEKRSKKGKSFFGCSNYPKCDFVAWYKPATTPCPECRSPYMLEKVSQKRGAYLSCPDCKHKIYQDNQQ
ncbi:MAG: type I DNA topoisomerase [candidate division Zixibacteria bacterium HGW-Zixibacteria-1]|nr:MAG: type I DNA topoisomerase [candidate division Zixibacteria bacterium HGW-Zixibacteria-1]